jgi:hypothetical protein
VIEKEVTLRELEERNFIFSLSEFSVINLKKVSIVPVYISGSGKESIGSVADSYEFGKGRIEIPEDCVVKNACGTCGPVPTEICDGEDNNCNEETDEGLTAPLASKQDGVCAGSVKVCAGTSGWQEPDYTLITYYEVSEVTCDNKDNDCNGETDEGGVCDGLANECDNPQQGWIWCDDFETDRLSSYFERSSSLVRTPGIGVEGSTGIKATFDEGQVQAGSLKLAFGRTPQSYFSPVDSGTSDYRDIYWRMYLKNQPGWTGGGGNKLSRATSFWSGDSWAQVMIAHIWSMDTDYLGMDPASGTDEAGNVLTTQYNDFDNLRWLGMKRGTTPLFSSSNVGQWYCVEAHAKFNDPGLNNGINELWINNNLEGRHTTLNWVGNYNDYGINAIFFENYWNAGSPVAQERYFDNIVVSTERIGC